MADNQPLQQHNYRVVVPWHVLEKYIKEELTATDRKLRKSVGEETLKLQATACMLEKMLNLPEILLARDEEPK